MPEETKTETVTTPASETQPEAATQTQTPATGESADDRIKRLEAELKRVNAESAGRRKQLEAIEKAEQDRKNADLSELEKTRQRLAELEAKSKALELRELQRQAAAKHKLPDALVDRLKGATLEELEADAEALVKTLPKTTAAPTVPPANPGGNAAVGETDEQRRKRLFGA